MADPPDAADVTGVTIVNDGDTVTIYGPGIRLGAVTVPEKAVSAGREVVARRTAQLER